MALEEALQAKLSALCPRTFPDIAPYNTARPYVVWQLVGGTALVYAEGALPSRRNASVQVTVWDDTRLGANALMRAIEAALVAEPSMQVVPLASLQAANEGGGDLRGATQDFDIWHGT